MTYIYSVYRDNERKRKRQERKQTVYLCLVAIDAILAVWLLSKLALYLNHH